MSLIFAYKYLIFETVYEKSLDFGNRNNLKKVPLELVFS